jgi:hypothetical protein
MRVERMYIDECAAGPGWRGRLAKLLGQGITAHLQAQGMLGPERKPPLLSEERVADSDNGRVGAEVSGSEV